MLGSGFVGSFRRMPAQRSAGEAIAKKDQAGGSLKAGRHSMKRSICGLVLILGFFSITAPASASAFIYWTNDEGNAIGRANLDGTGVNQSFITGASEPEGVAVDGSHIYWTNHGTNTIGRANLDGTGVDQSFITDANGPWGITVDGDHIYWTNEHEATIGRANLDGSGVNEDFISTSPGGEPVGIAVNSSYIYWVNYVQRTIGRANLDGTGVNPGFISTADNPWGLAVDPDHIYWINRGGTDTIGRANLDGSGVEQEFIKANSPYGVVAGADHLYWSTGGSNTLGRANLDGSGVEQEFITGGNVTVGVAISSPVKLEVTETGSGSGTVTSSPTGINCGIECETEFDEGQEVTLTAVPSEHSIFSGWSGGGCSGTGSCKVTMTAAKEVTATFNLEQHTVTLLKEGSGEGTVESRPGGITCGSECSTNFEYGTVVALTASPAVGSELIRWIGCENEHGNQCDVTATKNTSVTAVFNLEQLQLAVTKGGSGGGTVTSSPTGINCGGTCATLFNYGTAVTLKGTPGPNSEAAQWSGCESVNGADECKVKITAAKEVAASFALEQHQLTVTTLGTGTGIVTSSPAGINCGAECQANFNHGTAVTLKGTPGPNSEAAQWSGCESVNGADECKVKITAAKEVAATFNLEQHLLKVTTLGTGSGSVTSSPTGINCGGTCTASFNHGTAVTLKGTPGPNSEAAQWSGCESVNGADECKVKITAAKEVTATFSLEKHQLKVTTLGTSTGTVTSSPTGINCGSECQANFEYGTSVTLTGAPGPNTKAAQWSGCESVTGADECKVTISAAEEVTATFNLERHLLNVTTLGTGSGSVTSSPTGINCGGTCAANFEYGTVVTLTGAPGPNTKAAQWSGCESVNGADECKVTMSAVKEVTATFNLEQHQLKVTTSGTGTGTVTSSPTGINCGGTCAANFEYGTVVTLTGAPGPNTKAAQWSGCESVNGSNECKVTMSAVKEVTATFNLEQHQLKVTKNGSGSGTVTSSPTGINCGAECQANFEHGTSVTLKGTPGANTKAAQWSGCESVNSSNECKVTMSAVKEVTATFNLEQHQLKVTKNGSGSGTVTSSPTGINCGAECQANFEHGTSVTLAATPIGSGSSFAGWSGANCSGTGSCTVPMNAAQSVTATFSLTPHCVVPGLKGKTLKAAKKALLKADCKLGKVKGKKNPSAKVKTQKPKPGTVATVGSKVNITVK